MHYCLETVLHLLPADIYGDKLLWNHTKGKPKTFQKRKQNVSKTE